MAWNLTGTTQRARSGQTQGSSAGRSRISTKKAASEIAETASLFDPDTFEIADDDEDDKDDKDDKDAVEQNKNVETTPPRALTVSEALGYAKGALEQQTLVVEGEVSEFNDKPGYKAAYFTIADASAPMSCMMWRDRYRASGLVLRAGMRVRVTGKFTVYVPKGRMQFQVMSLAPAGEGDLRQKVARLAEKLAREGLMDDALKRPIPEFCQRVCVVTSPRGKAVHDVIRTLRRRNPLVELLVCGVAVEGVDAVPQLIEGLRVAAAERPDAILLVRGGGSYEDLMPFNDESLARAVSACPVPVVTGIGHEPDTTICDMVGDRRCSTPTAAAESVAPAVGQLTAELDEKTTRLSHALSSDLNRRERVLDLLASRPVMVKPVSVLVDERSRMLDQASDRLVSALPDALERKSVSLAACASRLKGLGSGLSTNERGRLALLGHRLTSAGSAVVGDREKAMAAMAGQLQALSPLAVIARGYAIAKDGDGHVVSSVSRVNPGDNLSVRVEDGLIDCTVNSANLKG